MLKRHAQFFESLFFISDLLVFLATAVWFALRAIQEEKKSAEGILWNPFDLKERGRRRLFSVK